MLQLFSVRQFRNLCDDVVLSARADQSGNLSEQVGRMSTLRAVAIYGPNDSGKTSLLAALAALQQLVLGEAEPGAFQKDIAAAGRSSSIRFEIEFTKADDDCGDEKDTKVSEDDLQYHYALTINPVANRVISESLIRGRSEGERQQKGRLIGRPVSFKRTGTKVICKGMSTDQRVALSELADNLRHPLLSAAAYRGRIERGAPIGDVCISAYDWFCNEFFVLADGRVCGLDFVEAEQAGALLHCIDADISGICYRKSDKTKASLSHSSLLRAACDELERASSRRGNRKLQSTFIDANGELDLIVCEGSETEILNPVFIRDGVEFKAYEESEGTRRIFALLPIIFCKGDGVFALDGFDRHLHPNLSKWLLKTIIDNTPPGQQTIFTTSELQLMSNDILRDDEVFVIDGAGTGNQCLYRLSDYPMDFDEIRADLYRDGRFGGLPSKQKG